MLAHLEMSATKIKLAYLKGECIIELAKKYKTSSYTIKRIINKTDEKCYRTGENHFRAKLSSTDIELIRECYETGGFSYRTLAEKFECGVSTIRDIVKYRTRIDG